MALRRATLTAFCRSLPHSTEDIKWGADLCFSIGGKMFAVFGADEARAGSFTCKVSEDDFTTVTEFAGVIPAPYLARYFWVAVDKDAEVTEAQALRLLRESRELVLARLPAATRKTLQSDSGAKAKPPAAKLSSKKPAPKKKPA